MASKDLSRLEGQGKLGLLSQAEPNTVPIEMIRRQKTAAAAFCLACQSCGWEDKEIYGELGIDAGYWSRIKAGAATLQADLVEKFCFVVNNQIYPEWLAFQLGCTLVQIKSEAERRADAEREARLKAEDENKLLRSLLIGRVAA